MGTRRTSFKYTGNFVCRILYERNSVKRATILAMIGGDVSILIHGTLNVDCDEFASKAMSTECIRSRSTLDTNQCCSGELLMKVT